MHCSRGIWAVDSGSWRNGQCRASGGGGEERESSYPQKRVTSPTQGTEELKRLYEKKRKERKMWERRFQLLLGRVLCRDCQQDMDDALVCGTYEQKRSWSSRDCCVCKSYSSCFVSASELSDTESDKDECDSDAS